MGKVSGVDIMQAFDFRGTVGTPAGCGIARLGHARCGVSGEIFGTYQRRHKGDNHFLVKMKYYRPTNPQTVPQQANRQKFADAMTAWGALSSGEKAVYNERAKKRQMFGWGLFIREYYQAV